MCCEICPRYASCEEEGNLSKTCCVSCPDKASCFDDVDAEPDDTEKKTEEAEEEKSGLDS
jgi:hypothetical protein